MWKALPNISTLADLDQLYEIFTFRKNHIKQWFIDESQNLP